MVQWSPSGAWGVNCSKYAPSEKKKINEWADVGRSEKQDLSALLFNRDLSAVGHASHLTSKRLRQPSQGCLNLGYCILNVVFPPFKHNCLPSHLTIIPLHVSVSLLTSQQNCAEYVFLNTSPKASSISRTLLFIVLEVPYVLSMGLLIDHE